MFKTLDVLIGVTTVLLLFSMAVTVITQAVTGITDRRGRHLRSGLAGLLEQLGIPAGDIAKHIADTLLRHPLISGSKGRLGTVIHREEFTKLLLELASASGVQTLQEDAQAALRRALSDGGIANPEQTLRNVRSMALLLESSNPRLPNNVRDGLAILHEASTDFVARVNSWFDQTIDRVSERFTNYTHWITMGVSIVVVLAVQLDIVAIADRLWIDDQFRSNIVNKVTTDFSSNPENDTINPKPYYDLLSQSALITLPLDGNWLARIQDWRKLPGMALAILLISLGAPFWYGALKDLLKLRSSLSQKDDQQRDQRQAPSQEGGLAVVTSAGGLQPAWLSGERGDLTSVG
jgi:hypothetical protein